MVRVHTVPPMPIYTHVLVKGQKNSLVTMLAVKRSAGGTPEVNLRNSLHAGEEVCN